MWVRDLAIVGCIGFPHAPVMDLSSHPGHRALRAGRVSIPGQLYLVTTVVRNRRPLFHAFGVAAAACRALHVNAPTSGLEPLCWVLMPDHLHLLAHLRQASLSSAMGHLKARIAHAVNLERRITEPVWARGFHDHALRREEDVREIARYIVANPIRAGLATSAWMYPYWDAAWL